MYLVTPIIGGNGPIYKLYLNCDGSFRLVCLYPLVAY